MRRILIVLSLLLINSLVFSQTNQRKNKRKFEKQLNKLSEYSESDNQKCDSIMNTLCLSIENLIESDIMNDESIWNHMNSNNLDSSYYPNLITDTIKISLTLTSGDTILLISSNNHQNEENYNLLEKQLKFQILLLDNKEFPYSLTEKFYVDYYFHRDNKTIVYATYSLNYQNESLEVISKNIKFIEKDI